MSTNTQRTMNTMRERGFYVWHCESWCAFSKRKKDLLGWCDVLCLAFGQMLAVQTTSRANLSARKKKILAAESYKHWTKAGGKVLLQGWYKDKSNRWQVKEVGL